MHITSDCKQTLCSSLYLLPMQIWIIMMQMCKFIVINLKANTSKLHAKVLFWFLEKQEQTPSTVKTAIFSKNVSKLSKLVEMLKISTRCKYGEDLYQTITSDLTSAYQYLPSKYFPTL